MTPGSTSAPARSAGCSASTSTARGWSCGARPPTTTGGSRTTARTVGRRRAAGASAVWTGWCTAWWRSTRTGPWCASGSAPPAAPGPSTSPTAGPSPTRSPCAWRSCPRRTGTARGRGWASASACRPRCGGRAGSARDLTSRTRTRAGRRGSATFAASLDELNVRYSRPQETGHRAELRTLEVSDDAGVRLRLRTIPDPAGHRPGFTLTAHTPQELDRARHPHELAPPTRTYLFLDDAVHGLGSAACGVDVAPQHSLWPGARAFEVVFAAP